MTPEKRNNVIKEIVEFGSDISGGIGGAIIGGLIAGPQGAALGGAAGPILTNVFKSIGNEITERFLSPREVVRIGAAYAFAINKISENESNGRKLRDDDFFESKNVDRPYSDEILEGMILSCQREYEEQKLKYLGNLYANICFDVTVSKEHSNQLLKAADSLSFRQFCILQLLNEKYLNNQELNFKIRGLDKWENSFIDVVAEIRDLQQKGLVFISTTRDGGDNSAPIHLNKLTITQSGQFFHKMLSLDEIEGEKLDKMNKVLMIKE